MWLYLIINLSDIFVNIYIDSYRTHPSPNRARVSQRETRISENVIVEKEKAYLSENSNRGIEFVIDFELGFMCLNGRRMRLML